MVDHDKKFSAAFDFDELDAKIAENEPSGGIFDFDELDEGLPVCSKEPNAAGPGKTSEQNIVRNVRAHAVSAAANVVLLDQEGQGANKEALRTLSTHFIAEGWAYTSQLGVPPQCLSQVQLELSWLKSCKKTMRKAGGDWTQGSTAPGNRADRTDSVLFIDFQNVPTLRKHFQGLAKLDQIVERVVCQLSAILGTSSSELLMSGRTKMMLERYQPGGYYARHMDADEGDNPALTAIYYLNTDWEPRDGGALRLWPKHGSSHLEIWPKEDTLVVVRADQVMQEVCVSRKQRLALIICFTGYRDVSCEESAGWAGVSPLRKVPTSVAGAASNTSDVQMFQPKRGDVSTDRPPSCTDSDSDQSDESEGSLRIPMLVCFNIVGFTREQGTRKFAGLFVEAAKLGVKDNIVLSHPEDHGIEEIGSSEPWPRYLDAMVQDIDKKARNSAKTVILIAHSTASAPCLTLAARLGNRVVKIYMVDGYGPDRTLPSDQNVFELTHKMFMSWSDADWIRMLRIWNPGSSVLREMATAVERGDWDVTKSAGAQSVLQHGKKMYLNAIYPDMKRDMKRISAPILAFSMSKDEVVSLSSVRNLKYWTLGGLEIVIVDNFHMGWLEPTEHIQTSVRRVKVFDRICEDISKYLESWTLERPGAQGQRNAPLYSIVTAEDVMQEATAASSAIERCIHPGERCSGNISDPLRIRCANFARGRLILDVCVSGELTEGSGLVLYAFPDNTTDDFNTKKNKSDNFRWVSQTSPAGAVGWQCQIQTHRWVLTSPDVIVLPLALSEAPRPSEDALLFKGVDFKPIFQNTELTSSVNAGVSNAISFRASLVFCPEEDSMPSAELQLAHSVFYKAFEDIDGLKLSAAGKETLGDGDFELSYGEVEFFPFWDLMNRFAAPRPGEAFLDLGSGTGRAVIAMALGFPDLRQCTGLEILAPLDEAAKQAAASVAKASCPAAAIEFQAVNFHDVRWEANADIVWVSSLLMEEDTVHEIARRTKALKKDSRIFTMTSTFGDGIEWLEQTLLDGKEFATVEMSFGEGRVYAVRRT